MTTDEARAVPPIATAAAPGAAPRGVTWTEVIVLVGLLALGTVIRAHGFTSLDLWYDDAWAAAPARVGLSSAIHMVLTAPGFGLALRSWVRLDPATTWFGQLPAFVLGLAAIPSVFALLRFFRAQRWVALAGAAVLTVSPVVVEYSTRLKEYPFDLLAACAILFFAERARRSATSGRLGALAGVCVVCFFVSAGCAPVVVGAWAALSMALVGAAATRRSLATWLAVTGAGCVTVWAVFLRELPSVLSYNWRRRGFLVDYRSTGVLERSVTLIFGGFLHALAGVPVPATFYLSARGLHAPLVAVLGAVLVCVAIAGPLVVAIKRRAVTPATAAALTLVTAIVLAAADRVPFGDGRTDEVLYPALLVCLASVVAEATPWVRRSVGRGASSRAGAAALGAVLLCGAVLVGVAHPATYPTIGLRGVAARLAPLERPGDVVFVDTFNSFGWCYYSLSPCRTKVGGTPVWPQGFRPVSLSPHVFIARHNAIPLPELTAAQMSAKRIWYVGFTWGTFDVGSNPARYNLPVTTYFTGLLCRDGWRPAAGPRTAVLGTHAYALLLVHPGPRTPPQPVPPGACSQAPA